MDSSYKIRAFPYKKNANNRGFPVHKKCFDNPIRKFPQVFNENSTCTHLIHHTGPKLQDIVTAEALKCRALMSLMI